MLFAIACGALLGALAPAAGKAMRPVGETFINLVRMVITPVIFLTVVLGIARTSDLKRVGRIGFKALLYFEVVTTFALAIGVVVVNLIRPGDGIDASRVSAADVAQYTGSGAHLSLIDFLVHIVPSSVVGAFAEGQVIQVVFFSILFGAALASLGDFGQPVVRGLDPLRRSVGVTR